MQSKTMKQGWEIKKLGECFEYIKNGANIKQERGAGGIPITRIETLSGGVFNRDRLGYADIKTIDKYQSYVMESGDLLLSHINSKSYIGRVVVYVKEGDETIIHGMNLLRLKVIPDLISPFYMYYYSQTHKFKSQIANRRKDAVNQSSISVADLKTIDVPVPPREEQERIVEELDCLSGVIERKREQLRELDALAQSIFYQMFGDPITNEKGWEVKKLGEVCISDLGKTLDSKKNKGNLYNYLCSVNVQWGYFDLTTLKEMRLEESELERYSVKQGDLLICEGGDTGRCAIWNSEEPMYYQNALHRVRFTPNTILPIFCQYIMLYMKQNGELDKYSKGQTIKHLVKSALMSIPIVMPHITLQQEFADKIEAIEKQKELIKKSISEVEDLFNSRMSYYFN